MIFDAAKRGLVLWFEQLIPSLLPFLIFSNLFLSLTGQQKKMVKYNFVCSGPVRRILGFSPLCLYVLFLGHFCGYPAGAKITADLYSKNRISDQEAQFLLSVANQSSPAFLRNYLVLYILEDVRLTVPVFCILYGATVLTAALFRFLPWKKTVISCQLKCAESVRSFGQILDYSIVDAFSTLIRVGGYVILFSVCSTLSMHLLSKAGPLRYLLSSALEITNGLHLLKSAHLSAHGRWIALMACTAFGGFSAMAQIKGMLIGTPLSIKPYIIGKCVYTVVVILFSELFFRFFIFHFQ